MANENAALEVHSRSTEALKTPGSMPECRNSLASSIVLKLRNPRPHELFAPVWSKQNPVRLQGPNCRDR